MNPKPQHPAMLTAEAAARRLLVQAIDLRFNLDDAVEALSADSGPTPQEFQQLRADADALCRAIDALGEALWPTTDAVDPDEAEAEPLATPA